MGRTSQLIESHIGKRLASGIDDAFCILDIEDVRQKYREWIKKIPRVIPFYAVKCNDDERVVKILAKMGTGFDCASKKEIAQVLELGVEPERIIFAHTAKQESHLKFAAENHVMKMTFDSYSELLKIKKFHPLAQVVLRIRFDSAAALVNLGSKFGCDPMIEAPRLIKLCKKEEMDLIGISFHAGSGHKDYEVYEQALAIFRTLFNVAAGVGMKLNFVDIGGGFIGTDLSFMQKFSKSINSALEKYFPDPSITVIAEPGRYFVDSALVVATQIILKNVSNGHSNYFINEGIFMSFMMLHLYNVEPEFSIIRRSQTEAEPKKSLSTIWGQSCNAKDKIVENKMMPYAEIGDWLVFHNMGAYTTSVATFFNGFKVGDVIVAGNSQLE